ncbi:hypothetical protein HRG_001558 [Hirsutella rhossiliensis]|uniref:Uncharacterized protein n=1 Tax=Hirsutella rhossiliensis TaxID=111463 RepID=A0A9P8SQ73_9HYPO|nr:uncharacterized protein HRG_01558 [Hirsutella rhossiliensis]KAH0968916.1 hypothetical protein HRG_01558 [Hirsutella rhossiliensis]
MSTDSPSTIQGNMSSTESTACGQTGHLRALDMLIRPASPTSEFSDTEGQYNDVSRRDKNAQDEIAGSPTANTQPVFAPSDLEDGGHCSSYDDGKENRPPAGLAFRVAVSDTRYRVEASGTVDNRQDRQVEMEFDLPLCEPVSITISLSKSSPSGASRHTRQYKRRDYDGNSRSVDTEFRASERRWQNHGQGHKRQRIHKSRKSKRLVVEEF